jgi:hypothetical protein
MIAANDLPLGPLEALAPDQLRRLIATAAGLLADRSSPEEASAVLRRIAAALGRFGTAEPIAQGREANR